MPRKASLFPEPASSISILLLAFLRHGTNPKTHTDPALSGCWQRTSYCATEQTGEREIIFLLVLF